MFQRGVLVTGGAGMIGSHIVKKLCQRGYSVIILDDLSAYPFNYLREFGTSGLDSVQFVEGGVLDEDLLDKIIGKVDAVIHAAAYADVGACIKNHNVDFRVNVQGTHNVLEASLRNNIKKFVFISSASVYGNSEKPIFSETDALNPVSTYGNSKLWGEQQTILFSNLYGMPATAIRYFSVYGSPQVPKEGSHSWCVAIFAMLAMKERSITVFGDGNQIRDFTHVTDIAEGTVVALEQKETDGQIFNIGTGLPTNINTIAKKVISLTKSVPIIYRPHPKGDPMGGYADTTQMEKLLNWKPKVGLDEGIEEYCTWLKNHTHLIPTWL